MRRLSFLVVGGAILVAVVLLAGFIALGGAERLDTTQTASASTCPPTNSASSQGSAAEAEASQILLASLQDAACSLNVSREDLVLALGRGTGIAEAAQTLGVAPDALTTAVLGAITTAVDAEEAAGRLTPTTALAVRTLLELVPPDQLLAAVRGDQGACKELPWKATGDLDEIAAEIGVKTGLGAACALEVSPLEAVAALADPQGLEGLATRAGVSQATVEAAVRVAMEQAINEAAEAGALSGTEGTVLAAAARVAPVDRLLAIVRGDDDPCVAFPWPGSTSRGETLAGVALVGIVDAACQLQVPTFDMFAALASQAELDALIASSGVSEAEIEAALRTGLENGVSEAQDAGSMSGIEALLLRAVLSQVGILDLLNNFAG